jgi:hypothetical protein
MAPVCQISKRTCEILHNVATVFGEVSMTNNVAQHFDVAVIGGGAADLSAGLAVAAAVNADLIAEETRRAVHMKRGHYSGHPTGQHSGQSSKA